jgi:hypothetical protein
MAVIVYWIGIKSSVAGGCIFSGDKDTETYLGDVRSSPSQLTFPLRAFHCRRCAQVAWL